jgi:ribonuclease-3
MNIKNKLNYLNLQSKIGYQFNNKLLLKIALTHSSCINSQNNEKMEFLGDSILNMCITTYLYEYFYTYKVGNISKIRSYIISGQVLSEISKELEIYNYILYGPSLKQMVLNHAILENTFEALIAAIYLDSDFITVKNIILNLLEKKIKLIINNNLYINSKSKLQELLQNNKLSLPIYTITSKQGNAHNIIFEVNLLININDINITSSAQASNRKMAETLAAIHMLNIIENKKLL